MDKELKLNPIITKDYRKHRKETNYGKTEA